MTALSFRDRPLIIMRVAPRSRGVRAYKPFDAFSKYVNVTTFGTGGMTLFDCVVFGFVCSASFSMCWLSS